MLKRITLVSTEAGPGHNCGLAIGLKKYGKLTVIWDNKSPYKLDYLYPDAKYGYSRIPRNGNEIIVVGCLTFDRLRANHKYWSRVLRYPNKHIIITDGRFARDPDRYNKLFRGWDVLTTGCKRHFREPLPVKTYYQPFDLSNIKQKKNDELTVAHSPFHWKKYREKGTKQIIKTCQDLKLDLDIIMGLGWKQCLGKKAKAHIFVDQISHYAINKFKFHDKKYVWPALGKSGLEAMHLGCLVITHGKGYDTDIPAPPVAWCDGNFREVLEYYTTNEVARRDLAQKGKEWALQYANYEFAAKQVMK